MPSLIPNILASGQTMLISESFPADKVTFDALITDATDLSVTVTDHPIEDGADVSDHIRDNPDQLRLDVVISQTPANIPDLVKTTAGLDFFRHENAWRQLVEWLQAHELVTVVTSVFTWHHMAIESLSRSRTSAIGQAVEAAIKLKAIVKVKSSTALAPSRPATVQKPQNAAGKATTSTPQNQSVLGSVVKGAIGAVKSLGGG